jgi:hypothetical protein
LPLDEIQSLLEMIFFSESNDFARISHNIGILIRVLESYLHALARFTMDDSRSLQQGSGTWGNPIHVIWSVVYHSWHRETEEDGGIWQFDWPELGRPSIDWLGLFKWFLHFSRSTEENDHQFCQVAKFPPCLGANSRDSQWSIWSGKVRTLFHGKDNKSQLHWKMVISFHSPIICASNMLWGHMVPRQYHGFQRSKQHWPSAGGQNFDEDNRAEIDTGVVRFNGIQMSP